MLSDQRGMYTETEEFCGPVRANAPEDHWKTPGVLLCEEHEARDWLSGFESDAIWR